MEKLKVLVVDDEKPARETLSYLINWQETAFELTGTAKNGQVALELYRETNPDLIITDIQMPVMDGLTLIKKIRSVNTKLKFVILTCHEEFAYAREALQLGVTDYLVKDMLTPSDLYAVLSRVENELEERSLETRRDKKYSRHISDAIEFIEDNFTRTIALNEIAETLNLHKGYLCRLFKQETGENISHYILRLRTDKAKKLILSTNYKLWEIAEQVGYNNIQQFNVAFKKVTGITPKVYRDQN